MKKTILFIRYHIALLFMAMLSTAYAFAQEEGTGGATTVSKTSTHTSTTTGADWYTAPWVWIVGAAVFILLLIAIVRGNSSKTTDVTRSTTIRKDVTNLDA